MSKPKVPVAEPRKSSTTRLPAALPADYVEWLGELKHRIAGARQRIALAANAEQIQLYHEIGRDILNRQASQGWGAKVIDRLSADLRTAFPDMKGLSSRNLKYMKYFAQACPERQFGQQSAAQLPWFHIVTLMTQVDDTAVRAWYAQQAVINAWSRDTLTAQIRSGLHQRQGAALTNFEQRLPTPQAELAAEILKDPYHFDFLGLGDEAHERDIENALIRHITRFLLELGAGFAFIGSQYRIEVDGDEFFIDLLFYHTRLKCHVVVELKATAFKPEHAGSSTFILPPSMRRSNRPTTTPPSACCCAKPKTAWSPNMPSRVPTNRWAWRNTNWSRRCQNRWMSSCQPSKPLSKSCLLIWSERTNHEQ